MSKCVLLSRVSTEQQSLDEQTNNLKEAAKSSGYDEIILIETKESAIKLSEEERQGLNELKHHIENDDVDCVFIWELSRLSRRPQVLYNMREYLQNKKVQLVCLHPNFKMFKEDFSLDTNANIIFGLYVSLCENEMAIKKDRFHRGKEKLAREGKFSGGKYIKIGYKLDENKTFVIDPQTASLVRDLFYMYGVKKMSLRDLYREMESRGYKKTITTIRKILNDISYTGEATKGVENRNSFMRAYPAIVSRELYDIVQERIEIAKHDSRRTNKEVLGKKIVKCPKCGHAMVLNSLRRYMCNWHTQRNVVYDPCDNVCTIDTKTVDELLWHMSKKIWKWKMKEHNDEEKKKMIDECIVIREKIKTCDKEIESAESKKKRAKDLYILGDLDDKEYGKYRLSIEEKKNAQIAQKSTLEERLTWLNECILGLNDPEESEIEKGESDFETKNKIVHECIKEVVVDYIDDEKKDKVIKLVSVLNESYWLKKYQKNGFDSLERIIWNKDGWFRIPKEKEEDF